MAEAKESKKQKVKSKKADGAVAKTAQKTDAVAESTPEAEPTAAKLDVKEVKPEKVTAKSGKRSAKALAEAEEKQAKQARKASADEKPAKPPAKPARSRVERAGKRYKAAAKLIDKSKAYPLAEAIDLAVKTSNTKFDASLELHINLGVDPKQADQNVRDTVALPAGTGKALRVAAISDDASAEKLFAKLDKEDIDFDVLIATPALMSKLGKYARLLGPRGLMPNPKSGTVTDNVAKAAEEAKAGKVEYRVDPAGIVHMAIGKAGFGSSKLTDNAEAALGSVRAAKPASLKGIYIKSAYVTSTMGPSIRLEL